MSASPRPPRLPNTTPKRGHLRAVFAVGAAAQVRQLRRVVGASGEVKVFLGGREVPGPIIRLTS